MDPSIVFDCQQVVPNRFALALAAAARSRALLRGAQSKPARSDTRETEVELQEIAGHAYSRDELAPFLRARRSRFLPGTRLWQRSCVGALLRPDPPRGERQVMTHPIKQEKDYGEATVFNNQSAFDVLSVVAGLGLAFSPWYLGLPLRRPLRGMPGLSVRPSPWSG